MYEEIGDVLYDYGRGLYANITNRCPCRCEFCIWTMTDSLGSADSLWLQREPSAEEVIEMLQGWELSQYDELVFCGYGEPTVRLADLLTIAKYVKDHTHLKVRINTNGLADMIHGRETAKELAGIIDAVSVSLNQCNAAKYTALCHPEFGDRAFDAILDFTKDVQKYVPSVAMSVVNVIPEEDVRACRKIAADLGVTLRVR